MYGLIIRKSVEEELHKLVKRDKLTAEILERKITEINEDPYKFEPLRSPLQGFRRVHIGKSFVLIYMIDEPDKTIIIEEFDRHKNVYKHPINEILLHHNS
jgi:YafQ family addiction module toxin component